MSFLFVDRILEHRKGESISGIKNVTLDDTYLYDDGTNPPYFMPSLIGEALGQLAAWCAMDYYDFKLRPVAGMVSLATIHKSVSVGESIHLESFIDKLDESAVQYHSLATVNGEPVFSLESAIGPMLPMSDFIDESVVRKQFAMIHRPGEVPTSIIPLGSLTSTKQVNASCIHIGFDGVLAEEAGKSITAFKRISKSAPYYADHFPDKPVFPLTLLLESKLRLAEQFIRQNDNFDKFQAAAVRRVKMSDFVQPGDTLTCKMVVKSQTDNEIVFQFRCEIEGHRVCVSEAVFTTARI